ncbi:biotin/lipoyl-binding protein [Caulobacter segnis]
MRPRVSGYIDGAQFAEGARVSKGQVLFQIDPRPYKAEADRAAAEVSRRQGPAGPGDHQSPAR